MSLNVIFAIGAFFGISTMVLGVAFLFFIAWIGYKARMLNK